MLACIHVLESWCFSKDGNIWRRFPDDAKADACGGGNMGGVVEEDEKVDEDEEEERQEAMRCR
ncbi:hypothetical protein C1H46_027991 [Malus baccata]|uniref:Uncharacterized protein n=1 Tax=Malus baccata TaxID=106549 RepID=A0A540LJM7_MALBA|nr:hypothetical protein C1H46_027991 [Malus baccata]